MRPIIPVLRRWLGMAHWDGWNDDEVPWWAVAWSLRVNGGRKIRWAIDPRWRATERLNRARWRVRHGLPRLPGDPLV